MAIKPQPPAPTQEIKDLIQQMGNEDFDTRITAYEKLRNLKYKAISGCFINLGHEDPEIAERCKLLIRHYYDSICNPEKYPSIYLLSDKYRFPQGVQYKIDKKDCLGLTTSCDLGRKYFKLAVEEWNSDKEIYAKIDDRLLRHDEIEANAMKIYIYDLIYQGHPKEFIEKILLDANNNEMTSNIDDTNSWMFKVAGAAIKKSP